MVVRQHAVLPHILIPPPSPPQGAPLPMKKSSPQDLIGHYFSGSSDGPQAFDMMVAAGPFTTTTELTYKPLRDLLEVVRRNKPVGRADGKASRALWCHLIFSFHTFALQRTELARSYWPVCGRDTPVDPGWDGDRGLCTLFFSVPTAYMSALCRMAAWT